MWSDHILKVICSDPGIEAFLSKQVPQPVIHKARYVSEVLSVEYEDRRSASGQIWLLFVETHDTSPWDHFILFLHFSSCLCNSLTVNYVESFRALLCDVRIPMCLIQLS